MSTAKSKKKRRSKTLVQVNRLCLLTLYTVNYPSLIESTLLLSAVLSFSQSSRSLLVIKFLHLDSQERKENYEIYQKNTKDSEDIAFINSLENEKDDDSSKEENKEIMNPSNPDEKENVDQCESSKTKDVPVSIAQKEIGFIAEFINDLNLKIPDYQTPVEPIIIIFFKDSQCSKYDWINCVSKLKIWYLLYLKDFIDIKEIAKESKKRCKQPSN